MTTSIWKKLVTAVRGGASEVGESIADANAITVNIGRGANQINLDFERE